VVLAMWIVRLGYSRHTATIGASILAFASPFWHFGVKGFYSEPYTTLALLVAAYLLSSPMIPHAAAFSGLALGAACGCRINTVILFPAFILCLAFQTRFRGLTRIHLLRESGLFAAAFSVCAFLIGLANYAPFGSPLKTGYHLAYPTASQLFSTPFFHGATELLFNGEVGLLIFAPWILVALVCFPWFVRAHLSASVLCGTVFLATFVFFAKYDSWHAGEVAGPRFLTPALPFLVMALLPCIEPIKRRAEIKYASRPWAGMRTVLVILVMVAGAIQCLGTVFPEGRYYLLMALYSEEPQSGFYGDPAIVNLYKGARKRPWWADSIPLASIDFLAHSRLAVAESGKRVAVRDRDQATVARQEAQIREAMTAARTEGDYLRAFPNSENLVLPNLMIFRLKLMGIPAWVAYDYGVSAFFIGLVGLSGIKRYAAPARE